MFKVVNVKWTVTIWLLALIIRKCSCFAKLLFFYVTTSRVPSIYSSAPSNVTQAAQNVYNFNTTLLQLYTLWTAKNGNNSWDFIRSKATNSFKNANFYTLQFVAFCKKFACNITNTGNPLQVLERTQGVVCIYVIHQSPKGEGTQKKIPFCK